VGGGQAGFGETGTDSRADPELVPEVTRDKRNAEFAHGVDRDIDPPGAGDIFDGASVSPSPKIRLMLRTSRWRAA